MELLLRDTENRILDVSDSIFCCPFNKALVHQVVSSFAAGARQGTRAQKSRAEVTGSGRKPWTQKGTGRARSGSVKSPIWRSGGVTFASHPKCYKQKVNKKMYRGAIKSIFSELVRQDRLVVVEKFFVESEKTKLLVQKLKDMFLKRTLIIVKELDKNLSLAARNLHGVAVRNVASIDPISLIAFDKTLITEDAIKKLEEMLLT